ncbi:FOG1 protein, partial [Urocolius indicus]|nr:FOG1 protein [Urocolius indicus]
DELDLVVQDGERRVQTRRSLPEGFSWGPFQGSIHSEAASPGHGKTSSPVTLVLGDESCWLSRLPLVPAEPDANAVIYRKDEALWCRTTRALGEAEAVCAFVVAEPAAIPDPPLPAVKPEPGDPPYPATLRSDIQLLPQQAGMAAILATAVVNKDVFPCKDCGIWYRSERNLQAHLMYYCASRQSAGSPALEEKPKETYPNERVCPFPQCKKSCPSASSLEIHMRSHSGERPFVCLICLSAFTTKANCERHLKVHTDTLNGICHSCGFISTTRDILYSHLVTNHMICQPGSKGEVYSPGPALPAAKPLASAGLSQPNNATSSLRKCSLPTFLPEGLPALPQHVVLHSPLPTPAPGPDAGTPPAQPASPPDTQPGTLSPPTQPQNGEGPSSSSSSSSGEAIRIKQEPAGSPASEAEAPRSGGSGEGDGSPDACSRTSSPRSLPSAKVKSELASPTPGSSPVPSEPGTGTAGGGGTVFLPQYVFGHEAAVVPQASEILAKMSELVHSRLKQGHGGAVPPGVYAGAPVPKGATCFECEITFNNINNYYVHKRLYCSSRHLAEDSPPGAGRKLKGPPGAPKGPPAPGPLLSPVASDGQGAGDGDASRAATPPAAVPEVKTEEGGGKAGSPEAEGGSGRCSEDSQSPGSSLGDEGDEDPSKTLCEACNIRFSRHETYVVHKRFYCASRHDPPLRRPPAPKVPFVPQPLRTRKRRKLYEIHGAARRAPAEPPPAAPDPPVAPDQPGATVPSPRSSPDTDGPIDLSKKPRRQGEALPAPLLPLADYHECTACRISFNSLDAYLAHKKYQCPATPLQPRTLEHLQKMKGAVAAPLKGRRSPGSPGDGDPEGVRARGAAARSPGVPYPIASGGDSLQRHPKAPLLPPATKGPLSACPYCPLNGAIKGDLLEHFRTAHGLFVAKPAAAGPGLPDSPAPAARRTPEPPLPGTEPPRPPGPSPGPGTRLRRDSFNGKEGREATRKAPTPPAYTDRGVQTPPAKAVPGPVPNGNHRYCRLCNIKFSSLSTFIAHKKYYCSSHAAEHVK